MVNEKIPTGIKAISIFLYTYAMLNFILGIPLLVAGVGMVNVGELGLAFGMRYIILGIFSIGYALLTFFIGICLWKGQKWARIATIILACLIDISAIIRIISGKAAVGWMIYDILILIMAFIIVWHLMFSKNFYKEKRKLKK